MSLIQTRSRTFMKIDYEIISMAILLPSADSRRIIVTIKTAQEKSVARWTDRSDMTIAVDLDIQSRTKTMYTLHELFYQ